MRTTMTRSIPLLAVALLLAGGLAACRRGADAPATSEAVKAQYHCPMHPSYVSDKPGECPICEMDLVPMARPARSAGSPVVAGRAMVTLSPERRQMLGVRSEAVARRHLDRTIRTVGRVAVDERRLHHVHAKYDGYVEHLYVDFTGKFVKQGDAAALDLQPGPGRDAAGVPARLRAQQRLGDERRSPRWRQGGSDLLEAARQRLLFWDIRARRTSRRSRGPGEVHAHPRPHAEHAAATSCRRCAFHGMRVTPADTLFDIADLSQLWVLADVYESDLPAVRVGMEAELTRALPARPELEGPGDLHRAHGRGEDPHHQGPGRGGQPGRRAEARHVRGRVLRTRAGRRPRGPGERRDRRRATAGSSSWTAGTGGSSRGRSQLGAEVGGGYAGALGPRARASAS